MGRPKKSIDARRSSAVAVKFTADERAQLVREVDMIGAASLSDLVRQRSLTGRVVVRRSAMLAAPDRIELNRIGVNLHQLVRHLNFAGGGPAAVAEIAQDAREVLSQINSLLVQGADDDSKPD